MGEDKKRSIFDRLKKAVDQVILPNEPQPGPPRRKAVTGGGIDADKVKLTTQLAKPTTATAGLPAGKQTANLPKGPPEEVLSPRRLAMIDDYMKGEAKIEAMQDPMYMYKIVSDERAYQTRLLIEFRRRFAALGKSSGPQAEEMQARIRRSQAIVTNLFKVLKRITGTQGNTGGTDFLSDKK